MDTVSLLVAGLAAAVAPLYCIVCARAVGVINRAAAHFRAYRRGRWVYTCRQCQKKPDAQQEYLVNANNQRYEALRRSL